MSFISINPLNLGPTLIESDAIGDDVEPINVPWSGKYHPMYGMKHSKETRKKMRESARNNSNALGLKRKPFTDDHKKKISEAQSGEKNHLYGKKHSEETKKKMRESAKTRPPISEETRKKLSRGNLGNTNAKKKIL